MAGASRRKARTTRSRRRTRSILPRPSKEADLVDGRKVQSTAIPAPDPGNIVGYEYEVEEQPFWLQDIWYFQGADPVRESHYSLQLPPGWEYKASWLSIRR